MIKLKQLLMILVLTVGTVSTAACGNDDGDGPSVTGITLSSPNFKFLQGGGTQILSVKSPQEVTIENTASWLTVEVGKQSQSTKVTDVKMTVSPNTDSESRSCTLVVQSGNYSKTVNVTQDGTKSGGTDVGTNGAMQTASKMYPGWNLGNTLEAIGGETAWQPTMTTQNIINRVKAAGFKSVRIPCGWYIHSDSSFKIDATWMVRVKEVVDYCINAGLYVVLNDHWDNGWIENDGFTNIGETNVAVKEALMTDLWTQIATEFEDYGDHLLFAGLNEPNADTQAKTDVLIRYEQAFINAVRATGGNNATRVLVVQGPSTDINRTVQYYDVTRLEDSAENALMVEVHYYDPGQFCGTWDSTGDPAFYYWGAANHASSHNSNYGEESYMADQFAKMKTKFTSKGYPVIIGEYAGLQRTLPAGEDQSKHNASVRLFYKCVNEYAINNGMVAYAWDTNSVAGLQMESGSSTIIDRANNTIIGTYAMDGIKAGVASASWPY